MEPSAVASGRSARSLRNERRFRRAAQPPHFDTTRRACKMLKGPRVLCSSVSPSSSSCVRRSGSLNSTALSLGRHPSQTVTDPGQA